MTDTAENNAEPPEPTNWEPNWTDQVGQIDTTGVGAGKYEDLRNVTARPEMFSPSSADRTDNRNKAEPLDPEAEGGYPIDQDPVQDYAAVQDTTGSLPTAKGEDWIDPAAHVKDPSLVEAGLPENAPPVEPESPATVDTTDAGVDGPTPPQEDAEVDPDAAEEPAGDAESDSGSDDGSGEPEGSQGDDSGSSVEGKATLDDLTVEQLKEIAREAKLEGFSSLHKDDLVAKIRAEVDLGGDEAAFVNSRTA